MGSTQMEMFSVKYGELAAYLYHGAGKTLYRLHVALTLIPWGRVLISLVTSLAWAWFFVEYPKPSNQTPGGRCKHPSLKMIFDLPFGSLEAQSWLFRTLPPKKSLISFISCLRAVSLSTMSNAWTSAALNCENWQQSVIISACFPLLFARDSFLAGRMPAVGFLYSYFSIFCGVLWFIQRWCYTNLEHHESGGVLLFLFRTLCLTRS